MPDDKTLPNSIPLIRVHLGEAEAKTGDLVSARRECAKAADHLHATVDAPNLVRERDLRANAFTDLGELTSRSQSTNRGIQA